MTRTKVSWSTEPVVRALGLLAFSVLLLLPQAKIERLISERESRAEEVERELSRQRGGEVVCAGPFVLVPSLEDGHAYVLTPGNAKALGTVDVEPLYRGIYRVPAYRAAFQVEAEFQPEADDVARYDWARAEWAFYVDEDGAGARVAFQDTARLAQAAVHRGHFYRLPAQFDASGKAALNGRLSFSGTRAVRPHLVGKAGTLSVKSNWPDPQFSRVLPDARKISDEGFVASWPAETMAVTREDEARDGILSASLPKVGLIEALSHYQQVRRTVKYSFWMLLLFFGSLFLVECLQGVLIPALAYGLMGGGLVMFYGLLLSQAEHFSFGLAYTLSGVSVMLLMSSYLKWVLDSVRAAVGFGAGLTVYYAVVYVVLSEAKFAMLLGTWATFLVIALAMWMSRALARARPRLVA